MCKDLLPTDISSETSVYRRIVDRLRVKRVAGVLRPRTRLPPGLQLMINRTSDGRLAWRELHDTFLAAPPPCRAPPGIVPQNTTAQATSSTAQATSSMKTSLDSKTYEPYTQMY
jgi:hypothetical protein